MIINYEELEDLLDNFEGACEEEVAAMTLRILAYRNLMAKVKKTVCDITGRKPEEIANDEIGTSRNGVITYRFLDKTKRSMEKIEIDIKSKKIYYF